MNFDDFEYIRPEIEFLSIRFNDLVEQFEEAKSKKDQGRLMDEIGELRTEFDSMYNICSIRHTVNTKDEFYEKENEYFDQNSPKYQELVTKYYKALLKSPYRKELEAEKGTLLFSVADLSTKTFEPSILEDLQEENRLKSAYTKIKAQAKIEFRGKEYNLSSIIKFHDNEDRDTRKESLDAKWKFYSDNAEKIEDIYDQLVKLRTKIAKKLGYKNFIELGYARMLRSDYNAEMVANYRKQILEQVVPIASELAERQRKRLGLDELMYHDEAFKFITGNAAPQGPPEWIVDHAKTMYKELSNETDEFFSFMNDNNLMDLVSKDGKATGGYCTFIKKYKSPYIFSNFNGTSHDIDVLTHEAGHAFQVYESRNMEVMEYHWPTYEACEIHSMSMEFFTWPWMNLFFEEDVDKYKFSHLAGSIQFLPYGVAVDEFQHVVYENPEMTPAERNQTWVEIQKKYQPHRNYGENEYLNNGGFWQRQGHIFEMPFYYIDYTLAQVCAFQFWKRDQENHDDAWADYVKLCKAGGSQSFLNLVDYANLRSPFEDGCVESVVGIIKDYLNTVDDSKW
jgi:M3 family oligoendopeptidase